MNRASLPFRIVFVLPILAFGFATMVSAAPTEAVARPTTMIAPADCVTSECHGEIKASTFVHGPVAADTCDACHELTDATAHEFTLRAEGADLCTYCHEFSVEGLAVVHKPVARGECRGCHDPHGGELRGMVREKSMVDLCNRCHESITKHKTFLHFPVEQGECDACHPPHAARFPKLIDLTGADLCLTCHADFESRMVEAAFRHKGLEEGCDKCHDVHGSTNPLALRDTPPQLCLGCHDAMKQRIAAASVSHSVVSDDRACLNCHTPHFSSIAKLQPRATIDLCMACHAKDIKTFRGTAVAAVTQLADATGNPFRHGEIADGQCAGCHDVHGGSRAMLLKNTFPSVYYERFSVDDYALCFDCHDARLVQDERTASMTSFRNGETNLHYLHANRDYRDRNCRVCHQVHASPTQGLIRPSLPYGSWQMPMRFNKTKTGGSCFPGCHRLQVYDREQPVPPPATLPSAGLVLREASPLPRAQHAEDRIVQWTTTDSDGQPIAIPDSAGPTVLIIVGGEAAVAGDLVDRLYVAWPKQAPARVVVIATGKTAQSLDVQRAAARAGWPVIPDESFAAAGALDVRGWPIVLVLRRDGLEVARLSADAATVALKLAPYLDLAGGESGSIGPQLLAPDLSEDPAQRLARAARTSRSLLRAGRAEQALRLLDREITSGPASIPLISLRVEALLDLGKTADALQAMSALPAASVEPGREAILRARIEIAQEKWFQAHDRLQRAVGFCPDDPELHDLLATTYAHQNQWEPAARHLRRASELRKP